MPADWDAPEFPEDNALTKARWELGKKLFYETDLSRDASISCASCHDPAIAFSDHVAVSLGVENRLGRRNAPTLANVAYHPYFTREGGVPTLEMQVLVPLQEHDEFDFNIVLAAERLQEREEYRAMSREAYESPVDAFVITRALGVFERTMISGNSAWDQYDQGDENAMDAAAIRGMELFFSKRAQCSSCHAGEQLTDFSFQNNGLYSSYEDEGRFRLTGEESDRAVFKVPTLRNVALTAPYMHDGSIETLEEVIEHYSSGIEDHPNRSSLVQNLELSSEEKVDLLAFLQSLTDWDFVADQKFKP